MKAYGFDTTPSGEAAAIVKAIANEKGLGKLTKYFKASRSLATSARTRLTWKHFLTMNDSADSWALGQFGQRKNA